ncbi:MAG TPA: Spy/CpxP family protein refolding chaperone [Pyrinomonadaceae bacterium]|nr:Spy/CpxP family protein refolding chaperone [Chloracidobacterium sp.]MBP9934172.1 Spy/CpxP family protein refolding chaperone [Pyrinomonadaceae bacterium]MBK7801630.1 Spy/CpxP family protein refolding chaperone [Chloracidobacterium sp.]MBK9436946.1 Spy/CpxP family protein refolding chaperone [Chloracidobacterium sp.]MBK9768192.1 Spy/CpxP family protein refolding chaperone [Chloracidobacterium sp.]
MSLKFKFFTVLSLAAATAAFTVATSAQDATVPAEKNTQKVHKGQRRGMGQGEFGHKGMGGQRRGMGMRQGAGMGRMLQGLDLTDAQKTQIQSIMAADKPSQESREEMRTLMMAKRNGTLTTAQNERFAAMGTERKAKGKAIHEQVMGVLTAEQKAKIETRKQEMRQRMEERQTQRKLRKSQSQPTDTVKTPKTN